MTRSYKNEAGVSCSFIATMLAGYYYLSRIGFRETGAIPLLKALLLSFFLILLSDNVHEAKKRVPYLAPFTILDSDSTLTIFGLMLVIGLGSVSSFLGIFLLWPFVGLGLIFFCSSLFRLISNRQYLPEGVLVVLLVLVTWAIGWSWDTDYQDPLFFERLVLGKAGIDPLFHSTVTNMIRAFGIPSTGLNGTPYLHYHWGSHWVFAKFIALLRVDTITFYTISFPIIFTPLFLHSFFNSIVAVKQYFNTVDENSFDLMFWMLLCCVVVGIFPADSALQILARTEYMASSPSYILGLIMTFSLLGAYLPIFKRMNITGRKSLLLCLSIPIAAWPLGMVKVSLIGPLIGCLLYMVARCNIARHNALLAAGAVSAIIVSATTYVVAAHEFFGGFSFLPILSLIHPSWRPFAIPVTFFWYWVFLLLRFHENGIISLAGLRENIKNKTILDVEAVSFYTVISCLPALFINMTHFTAFYLINAPYWIASLFLLARLPTIDLLSYLKQWERFNLQKILITSICVPSFLLCVIIKPFTNLITQVRSNIEFRAEVSAIRETGSQSAWLYQESKDFPRDRSIFTAPQKILDATGRYKLLAALSDLGRMPFELKKKTFVHISGNNKVYWQIFSDPSKTPFIAPALSGFAMVDGLGLARHSFSFAEGALGYSAYKHGPIFHAEDIHELCTFVLNHRAQSLLSFELNPDFSLTQTDRDCHTERIVSSQTIWK